MKAVIYPSSLKGIVKAPPSKSLMQRACAAAWIREGHVLLYNPGIADDDRVALEIIRQLGTVAEEKEDHIHLYTNQKKFPSGVFCGESGLSARMFTPLVCLSPNEIEITGSGSLSQRSFSPFDTILPQLGVEFSSNRGYLPLRVKGPLVPADIEVDGSLSSQFTTGLIMAYVAAGADGKKICVKNLQSKPYIDLTLDVLRKFGLPAPENSNYSEFYFNGRGVQEKREVVEYHIESDWSGGAFLLVGGAVAGPLLIRGLELLSLQADRAIFDILVNANAAVAVESKGIRVMPGPLKAFEVDASDCPDLFPPLVALGVKCEGESGIRGVGRLKHKESDRALALQKEFAKLGAEIELREDWMKIKGGSKLKGALVDSHGDHRVAMALAVAALTAEGPTTIDGADSVDKSYPRFFDTLRSLGALLTLHNS